MIFVTVGTHEQPFDRLVKEVDKLKEKKLITEQVLIQTGYSSYKPRFCEYTEFIKFNEMMDMIEKARVIVTHGGPGSIMPVLYNGKVPIVVPRHRGYGEHIDDHQVYFCKSLEQRGRIIAVYNIEELEYKMKNYDELIEKLKNKKEIKREEKLSEFVNALEIISQKLLKNGKLKRKG